MCARSGLAPAASLAVIAFAPSIRSGQADEEQPRVSAALRTQAVEAPRNALTNEEQWGKVHAAEQTGPTIGWDPQEERIVGDRKAAKMLTRPYRERWTVW